MKNAFLSPSKTDFYAPHSCISTTEKKVNLFCRSSVEYSGFYLLSLVQGLNLLKHTSQTLLNVVLVSVPCERSLDCNNTLVG